MSGQGALAQRLNGVLVCLSVVLGQHLYTARSSTERLAHGDNIETGSTTLAHIVMHHDLWSSQTVLKVVLSLRDCVIVIDLIHIEVRAEQAESSTSSDVGPFVRACLV